MDFSVQLFRLYLSSTIGSLYRIIPTVGQELYRNIVTSKSTITSGSYCTPQFYFAKSYTYNIIISNVILMDLTQMFGAGNEPSTTAEFDAWLQENGINPNAYIPYNAGQTRYMTKPSWIVD